jgi:hypothetical protein
VGTSFTLDAAAEAVFVSDGTVITLSPEEAATIATAFYSTSNGDTLSSAIDTEEGRCGQGGYCEQSVTFGGPSADTADGQSVLLVRHVSTSTKTKRGTTFGLSTINYANLLSPNHQNKSRSSEPTTVGIESTEYYGWPPSCLDIARQMYAMAPTYREARNVVLNVLKDIANQAVEFDDQGRPTIHLPNVPSLAYNLMTRIEEESDAYIQMQFWAGMYVGFGCGDNNWPDASGSGSLGGGLTLECHDEGWEISYDGGTTWDPITVSVCEYEM